MKCFIGTAGDCATPYPGDNVWMDVNGFIFAKQNVEIGYETNICLRCSVTDVEFFDQDNYKII